MAEAATRTLPEPGSLGVATVPLAAIVSSPLERCVQTAAIIAAGHGRPAEDGAGLAEKAGANGQVAGGAAGQGAG